MTLRRFPAPGYHRSRNFLLRRVLVLILCVMSGLMSVVVFEQGRTIDTQRNLIRQLFQDSLELNAARMKLANLNR